VVASTIVMNSACGRVSAPNCRSAPGASRADGVDEFVVDAVALLGEFGDRSPGVGVGDS
jgi:hypothetical protein